MNIALGFIGIDVSKDYLDIFDGGARRIANTVEAIAAYVAGLSAPELVLFEATGRYDQHLQQQLQAAGIGYARVNPMQARAFAELRAGSPRPMPLMPACSRPWRRL